MPGVEGFDGEAFDATSIGIAIATHAIMEDLRPGKGGAYLRPAAIQQGG